MHIRSLDRRSVSSAISVYSLCGTAIFISGGIQVFRIGEGVKNYMFDNPSIVMGELDKSIFKIGYRIRTLAEIKDSDSQSSSNSKSNIQAQR